MNARMSNAEHEMKPAGASFDLTVSEAAVGMPDFEGPYLMIDVIGADVRLTVDGTDPVGGTTGHLLANSTHRIWHRNFAKVARFIRNADTDATVYATPLTI